MGTMPMQDTVERLAAIGFAKPSSEHPCWQTARLDRAAGTKRIGLYGADPECSRALLRWRDLLARNARPSPYRISRA